MSALRDQVNLNCWECNLDLNNLDPIPPVTRCFIRCVNDCENGGIPTGPNGEYDQCDTCNGYGELVLCLPCYTKYLHSN